MRRMPRPLTATALAVILLGCAAASQAPAQPSTPGRPASLEDLLQREAFGRVRISPTGDHVVIERIAPWSRAPTYRYGASTEDVLSRVLVFDRTGAPVMELAGDDAGYTTGPFSPDGRRLVVFRLDAGAWRIGVMTVETGAVDWIGRAPEVPRLGRTVIWRSPDELLFIARGDGAPPLFMRLQATAMDTVEALWDRAREGREASSVYIPSGAFRDERTHHPPSRLMRHRLSTGQATVLAEGDFFDLALSPDGKRLAAVRDGADIQYDADTPLAGGEPARRRRLAIVDLDDGGVREPLPGQDLASHLLGWSDDGRLLVFARADGSRFEEGRFRIIGGDGARTVETGDETPAIERSFDGIPLAWGGWRGDRPVLRLRQADGQAVWRWGPGDAFTPVVEPEEPLLHLGGRLWIRRADGLHALEGPDVLPGRPVAAASAGPAGLGDGGDRAGRNPDPDEWTGAALVNGGGCDLLAPRRACLAPADPGDVRLAASPDGAFAIDRRRSAAGSVSLLLRTRDTERVLGVVNAAYDRLVWGDTHPVRHAGPDGETLTSWVLTPPGWTGAPPPAVVLIYPGAGYGGVPSRMRPGARDLYLAPHQLAAAGYAVLMPSLPLGPERPVTLEGLEDRILEIVDRAADAGLLDGRRVALAGHSYGAYGALTVATRTDRFCAVIAANGHADLAQAAAAKLPWRASPQEGPGLIGMNGWLELGQAGQARPFASAPLQYAANSPLYASARLRTPVLLVESDTDGNRMGALFASLYRQNREAALLTYFGEGHVSYSPANLRDFDGHIRRWLRRYLGPGFEAPGPVAGPDLDDGGDEEAVGCRVGDQPLRREAGLDRRG